MEYLLELNEFDSENRIDQICKRIEDTGYISRSNEKQLAELTGIHDIVDQIYSKVDEIHSFYSKFSTEYIDDILLEFFDSTPYTYKINIGVFLPRKDYYYSYTSSDTTFLFSNYYGNNYDAASDKQQYLLSSLLSFVKSINKESHQKAEKQREEKMSRKSWVADPRSRRVHITNHFKYFLLIKPIVNIDIYHKDYDNYWDNDAEYCLSMDGWNHEQFSATYRENSLTSRIKRRLNYIHPCNVESDWYNTYTHREWHNGEEEEPVKNPNPILLHGKINIKFE